MLLLTLLFFFLIFPALRRHPDLELLKGAKIAHRGLHGLSKDVPENSLRAFQAAVDKGYWIENDIHLTKDGHIVVFHDDTLDRMCGISGRVEEMTLEELKALRLAGTDQEIPTLQECLDLVNGQVPLLIEFKCPVSDATPLCRAANKILEGYSGKYLIQSFYPPVLRWYKKHRKDICRGQLSTAFYDDVFHRRLAGALLFNFMGRPDFISYEHTFYRNFFRRLAVGLGAGSLGWTFRSEKELEARKADFQGYIFEKFLAK